MTTQPEAVHSPGYEKGKLYTFNGEAFEELQPSEMVKVPVTAEALEAVKMIRTKAAKLIGMRPELLVVASAMLLAAVHQPGIEDQVKAYGLKMYSKR